MFRCKFPRTAFQEWAFPVRTVFGPGSRREIPAITGPNARPLVVTDAGLAKSALFSSLVEDLKSADLEPVVFCGVRSNPLDLDVQAGVELYREVGADSVVCVGGGSALDAGKCIAMTAESGLGLNQCDYFSTSVAIPSGRRLAPCVTVPTTAGTGAEMDSGSMYTDTQARVKRCAGHTDLPITAVLDPELTLGLPQNLTAWTGMDAVVHALEAFFVTTFHPMADGIAIEALRLLHQSLLVAYFDGSNLDARCNMIVASAMAAVSFQKGLGAVHGLSEPLGAVYDTHHGLTNAILLPYVLRGLGSAVEDKCKHVAHALRLPSVASGTGRESVCAWVEDLNDKMGIPSRLTGILPKLDDASVALMSQKAAANPTGFTNAVPWNAQDYERILRAAF